MRVFAEFKGQDESDILVNGGYYMLNINSREGSVDILNVRISDSWWMQYKDFSDFLQNWRLV